MSDGEQEPLGECFVISPIGSEGNPTSFANYANQFAPNDATVVNTVNKLLQEESATGSLETIAARLSDEEREELLRGVVGAAEVAADVPTKRQNGVGEDGGD